MMKRTDDVVAPAAAATYRWRSAGVGSVWGWAVSAVCCLLVASCTGSSDRDQTSTPSTFHDVGDDLVRVDTPPSVDGARSVDGRGDARGEGPPARETSLSATAAASWSSVGGPRGEFLPVTRGQRVAVYSGMQNDSFVSTSNCGQSHVVSPNEAVEATYGIRGAASTSDTRLVLGNRGRTPWMSTDGGESWREISSRFPEQVLAVASNGRAIFALVGDPNERAKSVYRSTSGSEWTEWRSDLSFRGPGDLGVVDDAVFIRGGYRHGLDYTLDAGDNWQRETQFDAPAFPWVEYDGKFYAVASTGDLERAAAGVDWSVVADADLPALLISIAANRTGLVAVTGQKALISITAGSSGLETETIGSLGEVSEPRIDVCRDGDVTIATKQGLLRYDAADETLSSWGPEPRTTQQRVLAEGRRIIADRRMRRGEGDIFRPLAPDIVDTYTQTGRLLGSSGSAYLGVISEKQPAPHRGVLYGEVGDGRWEPIAVDTQTTTCMQTAGCDPERASRMTQRPTSLVETPRGYVVGFRGTRQITDETVELDGGGLVSTFHGKSEAYTKGLPFRRCQGQESVERAEARSLCPPSIEDLTFRDDLWVATGDRHTDTFEVFRRSLDDGSWRSAHQGLPGAYRDGVPLHEDVGGKWTEADFAVADGGLFLRIRRMPADTTEIYWFDDRSGRWWPLPTTGLEDATVVELLGNRDMLLAATPDRLYAWSDPNRAWGQVDANALPVSANDYHLTSEGRVVAATDGRGVWAIDLNR